MPKTKRGRGYVYYIMYHIVWCTKYRHKIIKGASARALFKKMPELKNKLWGGHLWNPSYFVATVSENTESQIKEYIKGQQTR